ncbi:MAG TPA: hypothetical protein VGM39_12755 [Kofleriaceae bacterium]
MRFVAPVLVVMALSGVARADFDLVGGHAAYSIGGAVANGPGDGARSALDAGIAFGWMEHHGGGDMGGSDEGTTLGASVVTGFATSPTVVAVEAGYGSDFVLAGANASVGPVLQIDPSARFGVTARATFDLVYSQLGLRVTLVGVDKPELSIAATIGVGVF